MKIGSYAYQPSRFRVAIIIASVDRERFFSSAHRGVPDVWVGKHTGAREDAPASLLPLKNDGIVELGHC